jgi:hypothetical protein
MKRTSGYCGRSRDEARKEPAGKGIRIHQNGHPKPDPSGHSHVRSPGSTYGPGKIPLIVNRWRKADMTEVKSRTARPCSEVKGTAATESGGTVCQHRNLRHDGIDSLPRVCARPHGRSWLPAKPPEDLSWLVPQRPTLSSLSRPPSPRATAPLGAPILCALPVLPDRPRVSRSSQGRDRKQPDCRTESRICRVFDGSIRPRRCDAPHFGEA